MLDFGFSEILLTSAIALVVLGPERLPKVARQVGNWMGRARAMARQLSEQLEREVSADELLKAQTKRMEASMPPRMIASPPSAAPAPQNPSHAAATAGADSVAPPHAPAAGADSIASPAPHAELNHPHNE